MRVAHYLVRGASGPFYVRLRVPKDLQQVLGAKLIKRATGTRCPRAALACALVLQARYAQAFDAIRRGEHMAKPPSIEDIRANLRAGRGSDYVIEQGPGGLRIEATDQADHERAMQALEHIGRVGGGLVRGPGGAYGASQPLQGHGRGDPDVGLDPAQCHAWGA